MSLFDKNLSLLRSFDADLARRAGQEPHSENVSVSLARNGQPIPQTQSIFLHSSYDPVQEAKKIVSGFARNGASRTTVFGLGFGYHVQELLRTTSGDILVVEPRMSVFRAFLSAVDLQSFLPRTRFLVAEPVPKILSRHQPLAWDLLVHKPSAQISPEYFRQLRKGLELAKYLGAQRLKVLTVNPIYGGSLPTARFCAQALRNLGHEVEAVECENFADSFSAVGKVTRDKKNAEILSKGFADLMSDVILAKAAEFQPDLILALAQAPLTAETVAKLKTLNVPVAFWFVEDFRTLTYWSGLASSYDYFFTVQRGEFFDELRSKKANNFYYLPQACAPAIHKPIDLTRDERSAYEADLSFMGAPYYNRTQSFPRLMDFDFKIWGEGWDPNSIFGRFLRNGGRRVSTEECVKIYNAAKINLNLHSSTFHEEVNPVGDFINPRAFEIAACGAFQLVDERPELHELFRVGDEIVAFKSVEELKDKISYYLSHEEERKAIADRGRARVLREHSMEHRMNEMLFHIYMTRFEDLKARLEKRKSPIQSYIEQAGSDTELGRYLEQFKGAGDCSLKAIIGHIEKGEGALTKNELLFLMLDQVVKEGA